MIAYSWRTGRIDFGQRVPRGALAIIRGKAKVVRLAVEGAARLSYDGKTLLVPGIPEADDDLAAGEALAGFVDWVRKRAAAHTGGAA